MLHPLHLLDHSRTDAFERQGLLAAAGAPGQHDRPGAHVARTELEAEGRAARLPFVVLGAGLDAFAPIYMHSDARFLKFRLHPFSGFQHGGALRIGLVDRDDHDLVLGQPRRTDEAGVVAMRHDEPADEPR